MMLMGCQESIEEMHCDFHFGLCVNSETMFFFGRPLRQLAKHVLCAGL